MFGDDHDMVSRLDSVDPFGDLQAGHNLQRPDEVKWSKAGVQNERNNFVDHRATSIGRRTVACSWRFIVVLPLRPRLLSSERPARNGLFVLGQILALAMKQHVPRRTRPTATSQEGCHADGRKRRHRRLS